MPILYFHPLSPPARAVMLVAKEIGLDLETKEVDFCKMEHLSDWFLKINSAGTIPVLVDDGLTICDSHAINLYLIEKYAKNDKLFPKNDFILRTKINDRLFFDASFLFPRGLQLFAPVLIHGATDIPQEKAEAIHRGYRCVEKYLDGNLYLTGDEMTVADLSVWAWMESICQVVLADTETYPNINTWMLRMRLLPYYQEANKDGADLHIKLFRDAMENNKKAKK